MSASLRQVLNSYGLSKSGGIGVSALRELLSLNEGLSAAEVNQLIKEVRAA